MYLQQRKSPTLRAGPFQPLTYLNLLRLMSGSKLDDLETEIVHLLQFRQIRTDVTLLHQLDCLALHRLVFILQFSHGV